jgi:hypothetical protein
MPDAVTITPMADAWRDALGHAISGGDIGFEPETLPLETHKSGTILAITEIDPGTFEGGKLYYTQIHLEGSRAKPLSVSLSVVRESQQDAFVRTDPRHCREGGWLEVCRDPDYPWWFRCDECGSSPCCCGSHRREPWWLPCEWHWLGSHHEWS